MLSMCVVSRPIWCLILVRELFLIPLTTFYNYPLHCNIYVYNIDCELPYPRPYLYTAAVALRPPGVAPWRCLFRSTVTGSCQPQITNNLILETTNPNIQKR